MEEDIGTDMYSVKHRSGALSARRERGGGEIIPMPTHRETGPVLLVTGRKRQVYVAQDPHLSALTRAQLDLDLQIDPQSYHGCKSEDPMERF